MERLAVGVIGCGRMGKLHARVYSQMPRVELVGVYDANGEAAEDVAGRHGGRAYTDLGELLGRVKAVTIATPTTTHLEIARACIGRGIACLIEKPLAKNSAEAREIATLARAGGVIVQVGHVERFNPAVRAMERLDIRPRFIEVTRVSPLTFRSIDVGVVLDMMIHDIDIVLKLAGSRVAKVDAVGVSVLGKAEDVCNARLVFENGCVANLTGSRLAFKTDRKLRIFSRDAYVSLDYAKKYGIVVRKSGNLEAIREAVERLERGEVEDLASLNYQDLVEVEELPTDDVEPLRAEQESFVDAVEGKGACAVPAEDGVAAVEVAERIVAAVGQEKL